MSGYLGTKAVILSTTSATVGGDSTVGGDLTVDTNTLYVDSTNNRVGVGTASPSNPFQVGTSDLIVDSSGNVGIGTSLPTSELTIGSDTPQIDLYKTSSADVLANIRAETDAGSGGKLVFQTKRNGDSALDRMAIDDDGNVGIGTTSPLATLDVSNSTLSTIRSTSGSYNLTGYQYATGFGYLLTNGQLEIGTSGANILGLKTNNTERLRLTSAGDLLVGTTSTGGGRCVLEATSANQLVLSNKDTGADAQYAAYFLRNNSIVGSIQTSNTSSSFVTSSDYRLKENVTDVTDGITRVKQLEPKRFNFIANPDRTVDGFLAHEAQAVVPEAVTGTHNEVDDDGNAVMQGIDQSKLVPLLTAALKEAITKIETLETEMTSVKARLDALEGN